MRDAATSGVAEISQSDVPLACVVTPSRGRRNDEDVKYGCRDSALGMTRLVERTEVQTIKTFQEVLDPVGGTDTGWLADV